MNTQHLSIEELIHYVEAGVVTNVPGEQLLAVLQTMQQDIADLKKQLEEDDYDKGWDAAIEEMRYALERL